MKKTELINQPELIENIREMYKDLTFMKEIKTEKFDITKTAFWKLPQDERQIVIDQYIQPKTFKVKDTLKYL